MNEKVVVLKGSLQLVNLGKGLVDDNLPGTSYENVIPLSVGEVDIRGGFTTFQERQSAPVLIGNGDRE